MKRLFAGMVVLAGVAGLWGCQALQGLVKRPSVRMEKVALTGGSLFQGDLEFTFDVANPNPVGARLDGFSYVLAVEGKTVVKGRQAEGVGLPAMGSRRVTVPVSVNYMDCVDSLVDLFRKDRLSYEISGTFQIGLFTLPFHHTDVIILPKPPSVRVKNVSVAAMSFTGAKLVMELEISRESPSAIDLKRISYAVSLGGLRLFEGQSENIRLAGDAMAQTVSVPVSIDFLTLGKSAMALFSKGAIDYELTGSMAFDIPKAGLTTFPFTKTGKTDLLR
ncbi:hypothetical protein JCM14469_20830 [Desulfatiferula olefinivorans]